MSGPANVIGVFCVILTRHTLSQETLTRTLAICGAKHLPSNCVGLLVNYVGAKQLRNGAIAQVP
jgi:hypothetical protein